MAVSASVLTFGVSQANAQAATPCRIAAEQIALAQNGGSYGGRYDSFFERAFSECTNNGDNPFPGIPLGNPEKLCDRTNTCQKAY